jgi:hypothetical protein
MTYDAASPRRRPHASFGRARNNIRAPAAMSAASAGKAQPGDVVGAVDVAALRLLATIWLNPGSKIGISALLKAAVVAASLSMHAASWPKSDRHAPETRPT